MKRQAIQWLLWFFCFGGGDVGVLVEVGVGVVGGGMRRVVPTREAWWVERSVFEGWVFEVGWRQCVR